MIGITMTIEELIAVLKTYPQNAEVRIQFGDAGGYYEGDGPILDVSVVERDDTHIIVLS